MNDKDQDQTVLIVDDEPDRIRFLSELLRDSCEQMAAKDGQEALELVSRRKPDLILLDVLMPGMNGYEVCRRLQDDPGTADIPIIFVTAKDEVEDEAHGLELGAVDYITEPLNPSVVKRRVHTHLKLKENRQKLEEERTRLQDAHRQLSTAMDRIEHDIEVAGEIQDAMLPGDRPSPFPDAVEIASRYEPEARVGGDFFDYRAVNDDQMAIILADVCGHGLDAAFVTGVIKMTFELGNNALLQPKNFVDLLNDFLLRFTPIASFATVVYGLYNRRERKLRFVNGGHSPFPIRVRPGEDARPLTETSSLVLGATESVTAREETFEMVGDDKLVLTTDGVTEAEKGGPGGEQFGFDRLLDAVSRYADRKPADIVSSLYGELCDFRETGRQSDDIAILSLAFQQ
mgnify:CR=1 FL=1